jgi:polar amino acid transport system permease protein
LDYIFHFEIIPQNYELFLNGAKLTIKLSFTATFFGLLIGIFGALCKTYRIRPLDWLTGAYVEVIRNTPFLIQLFFIFFGLASLNIRMTASQSALIALSANLGAYATEIVRAGIEAIEKGKIEAGLSLGLSRLQVFRYVILFPALKIVYPALSSQFILLMLGSSIVSQISAEELTFSANFLQSRTFRSFEIYLAVTLMYLVLSGLFRGIFYAINLLAFGQRRRT